MNPKRRFFQIHLSTAVVLMLVAGVLVWANVRGSKSSYKYVGPGQMWGEFDVERIRYGWPECCKVKSHRAKMRWHITSSDVTTELVEFWEPFAVIVNVLVAFAILLIVWQACERLSRREARKANE